MSVNVFRCRCCGFFIVLLLFIFCRYADGPGLRLSARRHSRPAVSLCRFMNESGLCTVSAAGPGIQATAGPAQSTCSPCHSLYNAWQALLIDGNRGQFYKPKQVKSMAASIIAVLLLLSGTVDTNPGPLTLRMGCININSSVHKGALIQDLINEHNIDALAVCETKIVHDDPDAIKLDAVPDGYSIIHLSRHKATRRTRGGGLCFIYRNDIIVVKNQRFVQYGSFECQLLTMTAARSSSTTSFTIANIYRPPSSSEAEFFDDLSGLFDRFGDVIDADRFVACGDFNCGGTDSSSSSTDLLTVLDSHDLQQFVQSPTRNTLNTSNLFDVMTFRFLQ